MDNERIDTIITEAQALAGSNASGALVMLDEALGLANGLNYRKGVAAAISAKASIFSSQKNYKKALTSYNEALQFFRELDEKQGILNCLSEVSKIYFRLGDVPETLKNLLDCLRIYSELCDGEKIALTYNEIGKIYFYQGDYTSGIEQFKKALKIFETLRNKHEMARSYFLIGNAYNLLEDNDKSVYYLLRSLNAVEQHHDIGIKAETLCSLGMLHTRLKEYDKSLQYFNEALASAMQVRHVAINTKIKINLGRLYIDLTQFDKAIEILHKALHGAASSPIELQLVRIHQLLAEAFDKIGDHEHALIHHKKFHELDKLFTSEEVNLKTKGVQIKYDLEELKKQKEIAELSDKLKEQFLANVSHEIRTPMNGIIGMSHLLSNTNPTAEQKEYIDAILKSAGNLMIIITDILDFSKINAGKIELTEQEFNIRELSKGVLQILQAKADEKRIQLSCSVDYNLQDLLIGDSLRLNQILINLMGNAVKFTENGNVHLEIRLAEEKEHYCRIRFRVTDTGIGIPEDKLQTIFESFEQAENNKKRYEGTGLGLTIVKQLVDLQGGTVFVKSKEKQGSEFTVELNYKLSPNKSKPSKVTPVTIGEKKDFSHVSILVVEDNRVNQLLVKSVLRKFGFGDVDAADNGTIALEKIENKIYDIILMDIQMPGMDGYEITQAIRIHPRTSVNSIPVIALTADASEKEKEKARKAGMNDYVVKPYTPEELFNTISKYVRAKESKTEPNTDSVTEGMNLAFLDKFTGGDQDVTMQLIEIFIQQVPEALQKLEKLIPEKNWKEIYQVSHKAKSSLAIFELEELKDKMLLIEQSAKELSNLDNVPALLEELKKGCDKVVPLLRAELQKLKAIKA